MAKTANITITLDGSHGLVSNVSQHSGRRGDFVLLRDVVTDVGDRIVKRDGKGATLGNVAGTEIQTLHEYVYTDSTGATSTYGLAAIDQGAYIYKTVNGGASWSGQTLPITPTPGGRWFFVNADNRVFAFNGKDAALVAIQTSANTLTWRKAGQAAPTFSLTYDLTTNDPPYNTGTVTTTIGSITVNGIGTTWVTGATWVGKTITINGVPYVIASVASTTVLTLTEKFKEASATYTYNVFRGVGDWLRGRKYAMAYRNSTTGHLSNVGPVLEVTEQNQKGRTTTVTVPGSAENTAAYTNGYDQIQLFRTAAEAYTLVALNEYLTNNNTGAAITYVETAVKFADTYLTDLLAPFDTNTPPPAGLTCAAFHQDRLWALRPADGRLYFTLARHETAYGVAVECWPGTRLPEYERPVPEASGLLVTGGASGTESLIVQTAKGDYSVNTDGFQAVYFYVYRLRTRYSGGYLYSATSVDGQLVEFYRDKRLLGAGADIGIAIQDKLSTVRDSLLASVRLHWYAAKNANYLLLSVPSTGASTANDYTYVFNLDKSDADGRPLCYEWNAGFSAFATMHDATTGELQLWGGDSTGAVYHLLGGGAQDAGSNFAPAIRTTIIRPLGDEAWAGLSSWELYVNDASGTWTGRVYIHEQSNTGATDGTVLPVTFRVAPPRSQSAGGKKLIATFTHSLRTESPAMQFEVTYPQQNAALWIEKMVVGVKGIAKRIG